jgi:hypothetical protein
MYSGLSTLVLALAAAAPADATVEPSDPPSVEVVRIKRDFGKAWVDLAIDAWLDPKSTRLERARLWWVVTSEQDRRKPLGAFYERMVKLRYNRSSSTALSVQVTGDHKEFTFTVELGGDGKAHAYVAIDTADGLTIARCRTEGARLIAQRVLGLPVGLARIEVTCSDEKGAVHQGLVRHRDTTPDEKK